MNDDPPQDQILGGSSLKKIDPIKLEQVWRRNVTMQSRLLHTID